MNLKLKKSTILFIIVFMSQSVLTQDLTAVTIPEPISIFSKEESTRNTKSKGSSTKHLKDKSSAIYYDISDLDFISEMDLATNTLNISSKEIITYNRAQLTSMVTQETVAKIELSSSNNTISLENIQPGRYMLILSNDAGNIRTEEIFVF